jgi:biopolymer transport protein ExbD
MLVIRVFFKYCGEVMMDIERNRRPAKSMNLTPLIDVVFMLMIFFILTTNYVDIEALKLAVVDDKAPKQTAPTVTKQNEIVLLSSGATFVNGVLVYYGDLEEKLEILFKRTPEMPISVQCDAKVNVQMLVEVLDMVKRTGGKDVRVARLQQTGEAK